MKKRIIGGLVGLIYALGYGFFAAMSTGGGHVNTTWFILFFAAYFGGLFFIVAGVIVVDLRPLWAKISFGFLLCSNWFMTTYFIVHSLDFFIADMRKTWESQSILLVLTAALYFLPPIVLTIILVKKIVDEVEIQKYL